MTVKVLRRARLLAMVLLLANLCHAIDPHRKMSQYVRQHWGIEQGIPRGSIYTITQTTDGYLWIGSEAGLLRFDGFNFRQMRDPSGSATFTSVMGLVADRDGSLWIRLRDMTLIHYTNGEFKNPPEGAAYITATGYDNRGELLAAEMQLGAFSYRQGSWRLLVAADSLPRSPVTAVAQTGNGDVWMGTRGAGLYRLRKEGQTSSISKGLPDPKVNCLLPDGANELWVGTDGGIVHWNGTGLAPPIKSKLLDHVQVLTMIRDRDANMWVGSNARGLLRINAEGVSAFDEQGPGVGYAVTALFEDREGDLWIGSNNGIERVRDSAFVTYGPSEGLPTDGSNPIFVDSQNRTWFGEYDHGLWWFKNDTRERVSADGLSRDVVYSIAGGPDELWLGRQRGGLTVLHSSRRSLAAKTYTQADGLAQNSVYSVYRARDGSVWAGTLSGGVSKLTGRRFTTYTTADGLASNTVASILESSDGAMWFATPAGLSTLANGRWQTFQAGVGLPSDDINCLLEDSGRLLWAGTTAGLAVREAGRFRVLTRLPSILHDQILGLAEDNFGWFWIATSNHVMRVKRDKLLQGALEDGDIREYGFSDGLRGLEGVKRDQSVVKDSLGRIWFSLNRGISMVDPGRLTNTAALAIPHLESVSSGGQSIDVRGPVRIPSRDHRIEFSYTGISLSMPERVRFRYMLEGFDRGWGEPVSQRQAVYTNLTPGPYRFRLIASNPDGAWSRTESTFAFDVEPAVWQTWWFRTALVIACALTVFALFRLRMKHLTGQLNMRFEERLAERTRIAQDLHDTLLQGFLSASMHVHVAADRLPDDTPAKTSLNRALTLMHDVIDEGRSTLRGLRAKQSASQDLERAFLQIQSELIAGENVGEAVGFRVIVEGQRRPLHPVLRDEAYRIGREALVNAFRHAAAGKIEIELKYSSKNFVILVRDDGQGINPETLIAGRDGHWGLPGMRERADQIGARLHVWTNVGHGTEIELSIPGQIAFEDHPASMLRWFSKRP